VECERFLELELEAVEDDGGGGPLLLHVAGVSDRLPGVPSTPR